MRFSTVKKLSKIAILLFYFIKCSFQQFEDQSHDPYAEYFTTHNVRSSQDAPFTVKQSPEGPCNGRKVFNQTWGIITDGPGSYEASANCVWLILGQGWKKLRICFFIQKLLTHCLKNEIIRKNVRDSHFQAFDTPWQVLESSFTCRFLLCTLNAPMTIFSSMMAPPSTTPSFLLSVVPSCLPTSLLIPEL